MHMTGKLVVFEGLSAAGKKTQTQQLLEHLQQTGRKTVSFSFPDYGSPTGQLIAQYLSGKLGPKQNMVDVASLLYALDRYGHADALRQALKENDVVILDRYTPANLAFQGALVSENEKEALWSWIESVEKHLPRPDAVVFLDVPRTHTERLISNREPKNPLTEKDEHEKDAAFERRVHKNYLELARRNNWIVVACVEGKKLLSANAVHERVWNALESKAIL